LSGSPELEPEVGDGGGAPLWVAPKLNAGIYPSAAGTGFPKEGTSADVQVEETLPNEKARKGVFDVSRDLDPAPN
jgi:hypothetical protein